MDVKVKKVRLLELKPHLVKLQVESTGKKLQLPRKHFERRFKMGFYEVLNPELMPHFL